MTTPEKAELEVEYVLSDGIWTLEIALGKTTIFIETDVDEPDSLATLVGSMTQILNHVWDAVEAELAQEAP